METRPRKRPRLRPKAPSCATALAGLLRQLHPVLSRVRASEMVRDLLPDLPAHLENELVGMDDGKGDDVGTDHPIWRRQPLPRPCVDLVSWLCKKTLADGPLNPDALEPALVSEMRARRSLEDTMFQNRRGVGDVLRAEAINLARVMLEDDVQRLLHCVTSDESGVHDSGFVWVKGLWDKLGDSRAEDGHFHESEGRALIRAYACWSLHSLGQEDMDRVFSFQSCSTSLMRDAFKRITLVFNRFESQLLSAELPPPQWLKAVLPEVICHLLANAEGRIRDRAVACLNNFGVWFKVHRAPSTAWRDSPVEVCFGKPLHALLRSIGLGLKQPVRWALSAVMTLSTARSCTSKTQARQWRSKAGLLIVLSSLLSRQQEDLCAALAAWSCYKPLLNLIRTTLVYGCAQMETLSGRDYTLQLRVISISMIVSEKLDRQTDQVGGKECEVNFGQQVSETIEGLLSGPLPAAQKGCEAGSLMFSRRLSMSRGLRDSADRLQGNCAPRPLTTKPGSFAVAPTRTLLATPGRRSLAMMSNDPTMKRLSSRSSATSTIPEASEEDMILRDRKGKLKYAEESVTQFLAGETKWLNERKIVHLFVGIVLEDGPGNAFDDPGLTLGHVPPEEGPGNLHNPHGNPLNAFDATPEGMIQGYLRALLCELQEEVSKARREGCVDVGTRFVYVQSIRPYAGGDVFLVELCSWKGPEAYARTADPANNGGVDHVLRREDFVSFERDYVYGEEVPTDCISAWILNFTNRGATIEVLVVGAMANILRSWFAARVVIRRVASSVPVMRQVRALCNLKRMPAVLLLAFWCPSMYVEFCLKDPELREPGKAVLGSVIKTVDGGESRDARFVDGESVPDVTPALLQRWLSLNESQRAVVRAIVRVPGEDGRLMRKGYGVHIIQGPPGTGKSRTLITVLMVLLTVDPGARVLICAQTNNAVNSLVLDALDAMEALGILPQVAPVRVGHLAADVDNRVHQISLRRLQRIHNGSSSFRVIDRARAVFATNSASGHPRTFGDNPQPFTHMLADEAAQATVPQLLVPVINRKIPRSALFGDPAQLPATVVSEDRAARQVLSTSLHKRYELASSGSKQHKLFLNIQYRMAPLLSEFIRRHFYANALLDAPDSVAKSPKAPDYHRDYMKRFGVLSLYDMSGCQPWACECKDDRTGSWLNPGEARLVAALLQCLVASYRVEATGKVVVLTPYLAQVEALKVAIACACPKEFVVPVMTIDAYQGREADIVVLSTVRTVGEDGSIGFLDCPQRQNVSLTRGRRSLIIVAAVDALSQRAEAWKSYFEWATARDDVHIFRMHRFIKERSTGPEMWAQPFPEIARDYV